VVIYQDIGVTAYNPRFTAFEKILRK